MHHGMQSQPTCRLHLIYTYAWCTNILMISYKLSAFDMHCTLHNLSN